MFETFDLRGVHVPIQAMLSLCDRDLHGLGRWRKV